MKLFTKNFLLPAVAIFCMMFSSCKNETSVTVKTFPVINAGPQSGIIHGKVTAVNTDIIDAGVVYSSTVNYPKVKTATCISAVVGTFDDFRCVINKLSSDSVYNYRAYARTADTTYYGTICYFKPTTISLDIVSVTGGTFTMGATGEQSTYALANEKPAHQVSVSDFQIGKQEVTNAQFALFLNSRVATSGGYSMSEDGVTQPMVIKNLKGLYYDKDSSRWLVKNEYKDLAVVNVTWYGANEFCQWAGGRLPTEAEWEYAARGGVKSKNTLYSGSNTADEVAWFGILASDQSVSPVQASRGKNENELGIFDMSGNVYEWVADWYDAYSLKSQNNPVGMTDAEAKDANLLEKVRRGGCWADTTPLMLRVSSRASSLPELPSGSTGFRFAKKLFLAD